MKEIIIEKENLSEEEIEKFAKSNGIDVVIAVTMNGDGTTHIKGI